MFFFTSTLDRGQIRVNGNTTSIIVDVSNGGNIIVTENDKELHRFRPFGNAPAVACTHMGKDVFVLVAKNEKECKVITYNKYHTPPIEYWGAKTDKEDLMWVCLNGTDAFINAFSDNEKQQLPRTPINKSKTLFGWLKWVKERVVYANGRTLAVLTLPFAGNVLENVSNALLPPVEAESLIYLLPYFVSSAVTSATQNAVNIASSNFQTGLTRNVQGAQIVHESSPSLFPTTSKYKESLPYVHDLKTPVIGVVNLGRDHGIARLVRCRATNTMSIVHHEKEGAYACAISANLRDTFFNRWDDNRPAQWTMFKNGDTCFHCFVEQDGRSLRLTYMHETRSVVIAGCSHHLKWPHGKSLVLQYDDIHRDMGGGNYRVRMAIPFADSVFWGVTILTKKDNISYAITYRLKYEMDVTLRKVVHKPEISLNQLFNPNQPVDNLEFLSLNFHNDWVHLHFKNYDIIKFNVYGPIQEEEE